MCVLWFIAVIILDFVQCRPLEALWLVELQSLPTTRCVDILLFFLANSIVNCIVDFFTVTLPIHEVVKLQTTTRRKINICFVFLLGGRYVILFCYIVARHPETLKANQRSSVLSQLV